MLFRSAAVLVPQYVLVPWPKRLATILSFALPALALLLSYAAEAGLLGRGVGIAMAGSIAVSLVALACLGRRWPFAASLAALMLSYGGWGTIARSLEGTRTRSYFGIYEVSYSGNRTARVLTHGTTLHGIQNLACCAHAQVR